MYRTNRRKKRPRHGQLPPLRSPSPPPQRPPRSSLPSPVLAADHTWSGRRPPPALHPPAPSAMAWQPDEEPLRQLAQCLRDSLSGQDPTAMKNAEVVSSSRRSPPRVDR